MGGSINSSQPISYTELFESWCPFYLSIGMSYDDYWNGPAEMCKFYYKAYKLSLERENIAQWRMGAYIYDLLGRIAPQLRSFNPKGAKVENYRKDPIPIDNKDVEKIEEQKMLRQADDFRRYLAERKKNGRH